MRLPWVKWFPADWRAETELYKTSLESRGLWFEILCCMMHSESPTLEGTPDELSRILRCLPSEFSSALENLKATNVCEIECRNGRVKFTSRRLSRESEKRELARRRVSRFRENGGGNPENWMAIRVDILRRDDYRCAYCARKANTVDHVVPRTQGGGEDYSNLVAACGKCNQRKSCKTPQQAGMVFHKSFQIGALQKCNATETLSASACASVSASDPGGIPKGAEPPVGFVEVHAPVPVLAPGSGLAFTVLKGEIGKAYERSAIAHWAYEEEHLLAHICRTPTAEAEWLEILAYHRKDPRYKRQSVLSLLNNWASELDKARNYDKNHKGTTPPGRSVSRNAGTYNEGRASQYARAAISGKTDVPKLPDV